MSGLALVAKQLGAEVSGSDRAESSYSARLREAGIEPSIGHDAANVPAGGEVIVSTAIPESNLELARARELGLRVLHRGDLLAEAAALKKSIAVAGAHGKTTTTGMLTHVLRATGRDPAFLIGGELREAHTNASWGGGDWIVVEADESDRSFLKLSPDVAVITNIELDHHTTYASEAQLVAAFGDFAAKAGQVIAWENAPVETEARRFGIAAATTGSDATAKVVSVAAEAVELVPDGSRFRVGDAQVRLQVPGEHNVLNALAALAAAEAAGVSLGDAASAIGDFSGTGRRFEARGRTTGGALVYDDYAHHPTEVRATLEAARTLGPKRVIAVFQPHLYSRTEHLAREFGRALAIADEVYVVDIYPAREQADDFPGVSGYIVAAAAAQAAGGRRVSWIPSMDEAAALLDGELHEGDVVLTLGAGNIDTVAGKLTA
jgi:UDP-N-acetylmuramate--alanine ligase